VVDAPNAVDDTYQTSNGTPLGVAAPGVLANDTHGDGDPLSAGAASDPAGGSVVLNANGSFTYTADSGFSGTDTFTYAVGDGHGGTDTGLVTVNVLPDGASMIKDLNPGPGMTSPIGFTQMGDYVYFFSVNPANTGVWRTDGTEAGTSLVKSITVVEDGQFLVPMGGYLYFTGDDGVTGRELWRTDGTAAGTTLVKDINPGADAGDPFGATAVGGTLYFTANDGSHGTELWKSDGTAAGTALVKDILPGTASASPAGFTAVGGTVVFRASNGTTTGLQGNELWKTDGTEAGTVLLKDIRSGTASSTPSGFIAFANTVLFAANNGTTSGLQGNELWKTDGTAAGTVLVKDPAARPAPGSPGLFGSTVVGDTLYFSASDGTTTGFHGHELWKSDGTAAGTVMVKDINTNLRTIANPGTADASPTELEGFNGNVYFSANDGIHGKELWTSDGTAAGTVLVEDINPGPEGGVETTSPGALTAALGTVFFSANDGDAVHADEPWRLAPGPTPPVAVSASPSVVTAGSSVTATWSNIAAPGPTDWVGLYPSGSTPDPGLLSWAYTGGSASGSLNLTVPAGSPPGATYELRLFTNNSYDRLATSAPFSVVASATTVSASPSSVLPGGTVTATYSGIADPTGTDWVGLYDSSAAPDAGLLSWGFTNGTAAGSLSLPVPTGATPGAGYELRLFTNNTYGRLATSAPFSVVASSATVSASPASVNPGAPVTATWSGIAGPTATDWVGLYDSSTAANPALLNWAYTNDSAAGSLNLPVPTGATPGAGYELRLFTANSYTRLATSAPFSVVASTATVSPNPSAVNPGGTLAATWSGVTAPTATDWVGLYDSSPAADPALLAWAYTNGSAAGSVSLTVPPSAIPGTTYELRLFAANSYVRLATSAPFSVVANATISASPSSVANGGPVTATWSGIAGPTPTDWVGLYPTSGTADAGVVAWTYTGGAAAGSLNLTVPPGSPPGTTYELRLFSNNSYTRLATSAPFTVT
jgi:ELWxxDGT repeat protein